jgi:hypothetical protein
LDFNKMHPTRSCTAAACCRERMATALEAMEQEIVVNKQKIVAKETGRI